MVRCAKHRTFKCTLLAFTKNFQKKRRYPVMLSFLAEKASLVPGVKAEWPECIELVGRQK